MTLCFKCQQEGKTAQCTLILDGIFSILCMGDSLANIHVMTCDNNNTMAFSTDMSPT